jgi:hypothetical protein
MDPRQHVPQRLNQADGHNADNVVIRYSILGVVTLCTLISGLLGDSLLGVYRIDEGDPIPRGWRWLLGVTDQTFGAQTVALIFGVILLGFAFGGIWFLFVQAIRFIRSQLGR